MESDIIVKHMAAMVKLVNTLDCGSSILGFESL